jgi:riboflavin synthase
MFTGIIESIGTIKGIEFKDTNCIFTISCPFVSELKIDQSIAHNGVCLTVTAIDENNYSVIAIDETLKRTSLADLQPGDKINLERCMPATGRFDGHIVQGHVDQTAICKSISDENGSWIFTFDYDENNGNITVEKGSVCVDGVSLTVTSSSKGSFKVAVIPYTFQHTNFHFLKINDKVNIEFDILGKYIKAYLANEDK